MSQDERPPRVKVLLVDDDALIRRGYGDRLVGAGWDVTVACDGFEAVQAARDDTFDVILLDLRMPYRDGAEVLRTLRSDPTFSSTRVFLLAQPGDADLVDQAMREGAEAVFEKAHMGPRDVVIELQARLEEQALSTKTGGPPPAAIAPNVPSEVDEIASRFRRRTRPTVLPDLDDIDETEPLTDGMRAALMETIASIRRTQTMVASAPVVADLGAVSSAESTATDRSAEPVTAPQPPVVQPPPRRKKFAGLHEHRPSTSAIGTSSQSSQSTSGSGSRSRAPGEGYDIILNRYVGEAIALARALRLPPDLLCPVCERQLSLHLVPDEEMEYRVSGYFHCARCVAKGA